ncbi:MAG: InlB B-repeat-containing protein, partial [Treponema sp.]|nr:InlB B-repeat-containing protein [Treponema sp.]
SGFTFGGWNTNAAGTGTNYSAGASYTPAGNVTLYAKWDPVPQYTVTFDANGAGGSPPAPLTVNAGSGITLPGQGGLSVSGFTFGGWNTNAAGTGTNYSAGSSYTPAGNVTLYAKWDAVLQYTVTFDANGAGGSTPAPQTVTAGSSVMLPGQGGLSMSGYNFNGWNTNAAGTGTNYSAGSSYTPPGNVTLYARWTSTVTFDANGGGGSPPAPQTVNAGSGITLPGQGGLSITGFTFGGWNTNAAGTGTNYSAGALYTLAGNITLYAKWDAVPQYTVSFNINGAAGTTPAALTQYEGASVTLPGGGGFSRPGYSFSGWNTNTLGSGTNYGAGSSYTVNADITLYARWVINYTVTFNINGATGSTPAPVTAAAGSLVTLPGNSGFSMDDYIFAGWNTEPDGSGWQVSSPMPVIISMTLYAMWEPANLAFMGLGGPAASVSWYELAMFSNELSLEEGLEPVYAINGGTQAAVSADFSRNGYRLPSRAEWEAVKRGDGLPGKIEWDRFHSGDGTVTIPKLAANGKDYFGMGFRLVRKANGQ